MQIVFVYIWITLFGTHSTLQPNIYFCFSRSNWCNQTLKNSSPTLMIFVKRLGRNLSKTFSSNVNTCCNFTFGPRSHAPFRFFFSLTLLQRLRSSLTLKCARKYVHVVKAFAPLGAIFASSKIIPTLQVLHLSMLPSPTLIL